MNFVKLELKPFKMIFVNSGEHVCEPGCPFFYTPDCRQQLNIGRQMPSERRLNEIYQLVQDRAPWLIRQIRTHERGHYFRLAADLIFGACHIEEPESWAVQVADSFSPHDRNLLQLLLRQAQKGNLVLDIKLEFFKSMLPLVSSF